MNRSGIRTTEFWVTMITQALTLLTIVGVVPLSDADTLREALVKCVTAAGVFIANAWIVVNYIRSRTAQKTAR